MAHQSTRNQILQAAQETFTTKGFGNSSVSEICRQAGVSPPTLYYHFGNKDGLFEAVVEAALSLDEFHDLLREAVAAPEDVGGRLRAYVRTYLTRFPHDLLNPGLHLQSSTQINGTSLRRLQAGLFDIYQLTKGLLREGIAAGEFRAVDVDTTASCLMGTIDSFVRAQVYLGVDYDLEEVADCIVDLYRHGLAAVDAPVPS
jgi:AcrR family transcriptional regulator